MGDIMQTVRQSRFRLLQSTFVFAGFAMVVAGVMLTELYKYLNIDQMYASGVIVVLIMGLAWILHRFIKVNRTNVVLVAANVIIVVAVGIGTYAAGWILVLSSLAIGSYFANRVPKVRYSLAPTIGAATIFGSLGYLLPFHIYSTAFILTISLTTIALRWRNVRHYLSVYLVKWKNITCESDAISYASIGLLLFCLLSILVPTMQYDDEAYHTLLPGELLHHGRYFMDVASQAWALAPWGSDLLHGYIAVLAGGVDHRIVNIFFVIAAMLLMWDVGKLIGLRKSLRWISIILVFSQPLVISVLGGMQAEVALIPFTFALLLIAILRTLGSDPAGASAVPFGLICGGLMCLKASQPIIIIPLGMTYLLSCIRDGRAADFFKAIFPGVFIAGAPYIYNWLITGSPVFPIFNAIFHSAFGPAQNFNDPRWHAGVNIKSIWNITFHTNNYVEANPGGFGFTLLALSGAILYALRFRKLNMVLAALIISTVVTFSLIQYARYILPPLSALIPFGLLAIQSLGYQGSIELLGLCVTISNIVFIPNSSWQLDAGATKMFLVRMLEPKAAVKKYFDERFSPEAGIASYLRSIGQGDSGVLLIDPSRPFIGPFAGSAVTTAWYDPTMQAAARIANLDASGAGWENILHTAGICYAVTDQDPIKAFAAALKKMRAREEISIGELRLWGWCNASELHQHSSLLKQRDFGERLVP